MITIGTYIVDEEGEPIPCEDILKWGAWFETANRIVEKTHLEGVEISTVFLGVNYNFGSGKPLLYETMVFDDYGSNLIFRYASQKEAAEGHSKTVSNLTRRSYEGKTVRNDHNDR